LIACYNGATRLPAAKIFAGSARAAKLVATINAAMMENDCLMGIGLSPRPHTGDAHSPALDTISAA
jgi:hypothetical protein